MIRSAIAQVLLATALAAVIGWPALATVLAAARDEGGTGGGLMTPPSGAFGGAEVPRQARLAGETLRLVGATAALAMPVGVVLAIVLFRTDAWGRRAALGMLAVAAFVPLPLVATAWLGAFGNAGRGRWFGMAPAIQGWAGAAFLHALAGLPWVVFAAGVGLWTVEPELEESAWLDEPAWRVIHRVTLRRSVGAIAGALLAVAVLTAGDMTVTDLLQIRTYAEEAYFQYGVGRGPGAAGAVTLPPLILLGTWIVWGARALFRADPARLPSASTGPRIWSWGRWRVPVGLATLAFVGILLGVPVATLVWHAGRVGKVVAGSGPPSWSWGGLMGTLAFAARDAHEPIVLSAKLAATAATGSLLLAWALAWVSRRPGPWRWVTALSAAVALATPGPVAGMAMVLGYYASPTIYDEGGALVLALILRTFPYALLVLWPAIRGIPEPLLEAGAVDGLSTPGLIRRVAFPLTRGAALAAWGVAFVLGIGELPASNLLAPPGAMPISLLIWTMLHVGVESRLAGIVLVMLALVASTGALAAWAVARLALRDRS